MVIIDYFLPYNNFIVFFILVIFNLLLVFKRSYWQTFLIGNLLIIAFLVIIGFNPLQTVKDITNEMFNFFNDIFKGLFKSIWDLIF